MFLRWPFGHPLGEPFNVAQQLAVLHDAFQFLYTAKAGEIRDLSYRWRRESYDDSTVEKFGENGRHTPQETDNAPRRIPILVDGAQGQKQLAQWLPFLEGVTRKQGRATAYICENYVCKLPTSDPKVVARLLDQTG